MKLQILWLIACCLSLTSAVHAKNYHPIIPASAPSSADESWTTRFELPQESISVSVDIGRVAADTAGSILGALLVGAIDNKQEILSDSAIARAEANITPLRNVLDGFDVKPLALAATDAAFSASTVSAETANDGPITTSPVPQFAAVKYSYGLSPDFTQLRVTAEVELAETSTAQPYLRQQVTSIIELRKRSYEHSINVAQWSRDDGKLAKAALKAGFSRIATLIPSLLKVDRARFSVLTDSKKPKAFTAGFYGPELFRDDLGPTIWTRSGAITTQQM